MLQEAKTLLQLTDTERPQVSTPQNTIRTWERERAEAWLAMKVEESQRGVFTTVAPLTPALAEVLLEHNFDNRPVSNVAIERYERDIAHGAYRLNGQTIVVARTGELNDGQHRCHAVIRSGVSIDVVMVFGVERDSRLTLDQGMTRTVGHYLGMQGVENAKLTAAVAGYLWQHRHLGRLSSTGRDRPTKSETLAVAEELRSSIAASIASVPGVGSFVLGGRSVLTFAHLTFAHKASWKAANDFMDGLVQSIGLTRGDPIWVLQRRLQKEASRMVINEKAELIVRGWNAWRRGERPDHFKVNGGKLPRIEG